MIDGGTYQRGETITFLAGVTLGDVDYVTGTPLADLKAMYAGKLPSETAPVLANLAVASSAASGDIPAGWTVTVTDEQTADLSAGQYVFDVRCVVGSGIYISPPVSFKLVEAVTVR